jgi:hypothetical protein
MSAKGFSRFSAALAMAAFASLAACGDPTATEPATREAYLAACTDGSLLTADRCNCLADSADKLSPAARTAFYGAMANGAIDGDAGTRLNEASRGLSKEDRDAVMKLAIGASCG